MRLYDTSNPHRWSLYKKVLYPYGSWTITDASLSPDNRFLAYSSIRNVVCLAPTDRDDSDEPYLMDLATRRHRGDHSSSFGTFGVSIFAVVIFLSFSLFLFPLFLLPLPPSPFPRASIRILLLRSGVSRSKQPLTGTDMVNMFLGSGSRDSGGDIEQLRHRVRPGNSSERLANRWARRRR